MDEELLDILDPAGNVLAAKPKSLVHRDGDLHRSAYVWIVASGDMILLQRRAESKQTWPGRWDVSAAGHLSAGESAIDAAIRETREELGLDILPADLHHLATTRDRCELHGGRWIENEIHEVYAVRLDVRLEALRIDPAEVAEVALVPAGDLERYDIVPHGEEVAALRRYVLRS